MNIGTQIRKLRKERGYTQAHLAELLGTRPTTVASWEQGRNKPLMDKVQKMAIIFNVPISEIVGSEEPESHSNIIYPKGLKRVTVPVIGEIACGDPITAEENIDGYTEVIFDREIPSGNLFALRCKGQSMEPTIPDGSMVIIKSQPMVEDGEIAAVLVDNDNEATLKRIKHQGDLIMLMPDNQEYDPIILDKNHPGRIVGKAIRYTASLNEKY